MTCEKCAAICDHAERLAAAAARFSMDGGAFAGVIQFAADGVPEPLATSLRGAVERFREACGRFDAALAKNPAGPRMGTEPNGNDAGSAGPGSAGPDACVEQFKERDLAALREAGEAVIPFLCAEVPVDFVKDGEAWNTRARFLALHAEAYNRFRDGWIARKKHHDQSEPRTENSATAPKRQK